MTLAPKGDGGSSKNSHVKSVIQIQAIPEHVDMGDGDRGTFWTCESEGSNISRALDRPLEMGGAIPGSTIDYMP